MEGRNEQPLATLANLRLPGNLLSFKIDDLKFVQSDADHEMGPFSGNLNSTNKPSPNNTFGAEAPY